jgi:hypothetical protein
MSQRRKVMRKLFILIALGGLLSFPLMAQDDPKAEVFGGYQYLRLNNVGGCGDSNGCPNANSNGWDASVTGNFSSHFGVTGDFGGAYGTVQGFSLHTYTYTGGPVVSFHEGKVNPFVHALFGGVHESVSGSKGDETASISKTGFTMLYVAAWTSK